MRPFRVIIFYTVTILWMSVKPSSQQELACNPETESEFRLGFDISDISKTIENNFPPSGSIVWKLQPNRNRHDLNATLRYQSYSSWEEVPVEEAICIPKNECLLLVMEDLATDHFHIQVDSLPITPGKAFPLHAEGTSSRSTTQVGHSCIPTCLPNESLLNLTVFTAGSGLLDWDIINIKNNRQFLISSCRHHSDSTTEGISVCDWDAWETYHVHKCVPTNECYRFIWNDHSVNSHNDVDDDAPRVFLSFSNHNSGIPSTNTTTIEFQPNRLDTVRFGNPEYCNSPCESDDEALLELLMTRNDDNGDNVSPAAADSFEWSLVDLVRHIVASINPISWNNEGSWHIVQQCIRRDACFEFFLSVPDTAMTQSEGRYLLLWDDIIFANTEYSFTSVQGDKMLDTTITDGVMIGTCRFSDNVCDPSSESLLVVELEANNSGRYSLELNVQGDGTELAYAMAEGYFGQNRPSYRHYDCIPKECFKLDISVDANADADAVVRYTAALDNKVLIGDHPQSGKVSSRYCPEDDRFSAGAIAGIVIGSLAAAMVCFVLMFRIVSLKKEIDDGRVDEDDKTTASDDHHVDELVRE